MTEAAAGDLRPVQNDTGTWDALDESGYGHLLSLANADLVLLWLDGYNTGARENM